MNDNQSKPGADSEHLGVRTCKGGKPEAHLLKRRGKGLELGIHFVEGKGDGDASVEEGDKPPAA